MWTRALHPGRLARPCLGRPASPLRVRRRFSAVRVCACHPSAILVSQAVPMLPAHSLSASRAVFRRRRRPLVAVRCPGLPALRPDFCDDVLRDTRSHVRAGRLVEASPTATSICFVPTRRGCLSPPLGSAAVAVAAASVVLSWAVTSACASWSLAVSGSDFYRPCRVRGAEPANLAGWGPHLSSPGSRARRVRPFACLSLWSPPRMVFGSLPLKSFLSGTFLLFFFPFRSTVTLSLSP